MQVAPAGSGTATLRHSADKLFRQVFAESAGSAVVP
jgi:hypothetical protein